MGENIKKENGRKTEMRRIIDVKGGILMIMNWELEEEEG